MTHSRFKNLILIGNGFDRWQNIPSSYGHFQEYYGAHLVQTVKTLGFPLYNDIFEKDLSEPISAAELVFGDIFSPKGLTWDFFGNFESALDKIDDQKILLFFGRSKESIEAVRRMTDEALCIVRTLFCGWVQSLDIKPCDSGYRFPSDCFVINFNYTDTPEKRFFVDSQNTFHIHGTATDPDSIIFGHATHPETAFRELAEHKLMKPINGDELPRMKGLYAIEDVLYRTDKHTYDNLDRLLEYMTENGVHIEDIENIYVLGHSFSEPDYDYFAYLDSVTRCGCDYDGLSAAARIDTGMLASMVYGEDEDARHERMIEQYMHNIKYATHRRERVFPQEVDFYKELADAEKALGINLYHPEDAARAVKQRFYMEQTERTRTVLKRMVNRRFLDDIPDGCQSILGLARCFDGIHAPRTRNATWHISYHSSEDKTRIAKVMKRLGQKRYTPYKGIDACLEAFRV